MTHEEKLTLIRILEWIIRNPNVYSEKLKEELNVLYSLFMDDTYGLKEWSE